MMYVDSRYITVARRSELFQHEHRMTQLCRQVAHISKAVAWELEQHQQRLKELQLVEEAFAKETQATSGFVFQPLVEPTPSPGGKWTKFRKHSHRSFHEPAGEPVG